MNPRDLLNNIKKGNFNSETIAAFIDYSEELLKNGEKNTLGAVFDNLLPYAHVSDARKKIVRETLRKGNLALIHAWGVALRPNDSWDKLGYSVVIEALQEGDREVVRSFLKDEESCSSFLIMTDYHSGAVPSSPIAIAAASGHIEIVKELWDAGVNVMQKNENKYNDKPGHLVEMWKETWGKGALMRAAGEGYKDIVEMFLKMDDGRYVKDWLLYDKNKSCVPMHEAARRGHHEIVQMLLDASDEELVHEQLFSRRGDAIEDAARFGHTKVVKVFLAAGEKYGKRDEVEKLIQCRSDAWERSEERMREEGSLKSIEKAFESRDIVRLKALSKKDVYWENRRRAAPRYRLAMADQIAKKNPLSSSIQVLKNDFFK